MAGLAFLKSYSQGELLVLGFITFAVVCLLGLFGHALLGARGFGTAGNAVLIAAGGGLALVLHNVIVRQPGFNAYGVSSSALLTGLMVGCALAVLLAAAFLKRNYG